MSDETKPDLPATTEDAGNTELDLANENTASTDIDTVADLVSSLSLPTWIARSASKAFRQLCSAAAEWPSAFFKGKASKINATTAADTKITEAITDQIIQEMKVPPEYAQIIVKKHLEKIIGEQLNLDKISAIAANELNKDESNNSSDQNTGESNEQQSTDSTNQDANSSEEKIINDDWLNSFETEARSKSTEEMQLRFGRILAGEIEKPGSYSIRAIKLLGELDQNTAILFKKFCSACVVYGVFGVSNSEHIFDARVPSLGGRAEANALSKYGLRFGQLNILNEYNLIISDYNSWYDYNLCIINKDNPVLLPLQYQGKPWALLPMPDWNSKPELRISGVSLSHVGRELFRIVDQDPMPEYTDDLKKFFVTQKLQMVEFPSSGPIVLKGTTS